MENLFEYRHKMDTLYFTAEQKARLAAQVEAAAETKKHSARRPARRMTTAAVILAAVFALGGGAAAAGVTGRFFAPVFGTSHMETVNRIGHSIGVSATDGGITITADAIIGDKYNACVIYTIERADGSLLGLPAGVMISNLQFEQTDLYLDGESSGHGASWFTKSESHGNAVQYVEEISVDNPVNPGRLRESFSNLQYFDQDAGKTVSLCDGNWKLQFNANYEDSSVTLPAGETFAQNGISFTVTGISISPVALHIEYEADSEADLKDDSGGDGREPSQISNASDRYLGGVSVMLTKRDGSKLDLTRFGGSLRPSGGKTECVKSGVFREIVPLKDIKSVSIGGTEIPVEPSR